MGRDDGDQSRFLGNWSPTPPLKAKMWLRGGVSGQLPRNFNWSGMKTVSISIIQRSTIKTSDEHFHKSKIGVKTTCLQFPTCHCGDTRTLWSICSKPLGLPWCKNLWTFSLFRTFCFPWFYCVDFFFSFILRHSCASRVLTPRTSQTFSYLNLLKAVEA